MARQSGPGSARSARLDRAWQPRFGMGRRGSVRLVRAWFGSAARVRSVVEWVGVARQDMAALARRC